MRGFLPRSETKAVQRGRSAPSSITMRGQNSSYRSTWSTERSLNEAMGRVTWVFRAMDAIASNQARLPILLRKDDAETGTEIRKHPLLPVLNNRANIGEDSHAFRYRLSCQLLISSKGVFIEIVRNRAGEPIALVLQPPGSISPIPDRQRFVSGFKVSTPGEQDKILAPEDVVWIRKPHPIDPYGAMTPLEAAGLAIEMDWLAKLYNRNFLINDGRPGGLIVIKGVVSDSDKEELRTRYRGNINNAGRIGVIGSDEGADFLDTAITPRDAQYSDGRQQTKEEILMAFGVPQSVLSNASGRSFDNAEQERLIFWQETMRPHLNMIANPLNILTPEDNIFTVFDVSIVDVLQRAEIKRREHLLKEHEGGLITANEYREETQRTDTLWGGDTLYILNTHMAVAGTTNDSKKRDDKGGEAVVAKQAADAAKEQANAQAEAAAARLATQPDPNAPKPQGRPPRPVGHVSAESEAVRKPSHTVDQQPKDAGHEQVVRIVLDQKGEVEEDRTEEDIERWSIILEKGLDRFLGRQQRVLKEKLMGAKVRQTWREKEFSVSTIWDDRVWDSQLVEDMDPLLAGVMEEFGESIAKTLNVKAVPVNNALLVSEREKHFEKILEFNQMTKNRIAELFEEGITLGESAETLASGIDGIYDGLRDLETERVAKRVVTGAANAARVLQAQLCTKGNLKKVWQSSQISKMSNSLGSLNGMKVDFDKPFKTELGPVRYPGDPECVFSEGRNSCDLVSISE